MRARFYPILISGCLFLTGGSVSADDVSAGNSPATSQSTAHEENGVIVLPAIIKEYQSAPIDAAPPPSSRIQVDTGVGAKVIDPSLNELSIEQSSMERLEEIGQNRRSDPWWLSPDPKDGQWASVLHLDYSDDQKMKAKSVGEFFNQPALIEGGMSRDHRSVPYLDNHGNPYDPQSSSVGHYSLRKDSEYGKFQMNTSVVRFLNDIDYKSEDIHAGSVQTGTKDQIQASINGEWSTPGPALRPFVQFRDQKFDSVIDSLISNDTTGWRGGMQGELNLSKTLTLETSSSYETLDRKYSDGSVATFARLDQRLTSELKWTDNPWIEVKSHLLTEIANDQQNQGGAVSSVSPSSTTAIWDAGVDLSSSHRFELGAEGKIRRFALLPTPTQHFGDGALLQPNLTLPPETGTRASLGPWWKTKHQELSLEAFAETGSNAPIVIAVSPSTAKTLPLGKVWVRGLELDEKILLRHFTFEQTYSFQQALNDSDINWQKGQPIPGRPEHVLSSRADYEQAGFKAGLSYSYTSQDALDLGGLWFAPPVQKLDTYVGYGRKTWEVRLVGENLLPNTVPPENGQFQGIASPNLLEPTFSETEIRIQCEIII